MVLLEHTFAKLYNKLENHHNHNHHHHQNQTNHDHYNQPEKFLASLHAFRCEVSRFIGQLSLDVLKPGGGPSSSEILFLSLTWIEKCFGILPFTNKAFANLVVDIDYPLSTWEVGSIEGYLSYSLCLLEIFNSISSSLSHLAQSRLSLAHGLSVLEDSSLPSSMATKHLKPIEPCCSNFNVNFANELSKESDQGRIFSGKEWVVSEALKEMKSLGFWVCGILLSGLCSNNKPYMELREILGGFDGSLVVTLDSKINEQIMEKIPVLKEVKEINDSVAQVLVDGSDVAAKEMQTKLQVLENLCDVVRTMVDDMFNKVMTQRTELIDCLRLKKGPKNSVV
ncbi:protein BPS1, chloroplastic-like [Arachis stenosperma]|uniref:protein BPS1, chloroplastic-like n=1 Tax=Arachis stenosperma TaxID=217475 RepID=UPI0025AB8DF8|nr:protein BPS1, chloroplastic-like [Arachis stenosperma]